MVMIMINTKVMIMRRIRMMRAMTKLEKSLT